jgi:hypothetical protein
MPATELLGHQIAVQMRMWRLEVREADVAARACESLLRRLQLPPPLAIQHLWDANRLCLDGRFDEGWQAYQSSFHEQRALGFFGTDALAAVLAALIGAIRGRWEQVTPLLPALEMVGPYFATTVRIWVAGATGQPELARRLAEADETPLLHDWAEVAALAARGEAVIAAGSVAAARQIYDLLLPFSGRLAAAGNSFSMGPVDYYLGRLARALGEDAVAQRHLNAADRDCRREGLTWWTEQIAAARPVPARS